VADALVEHYGAVDGGNTARNLAAHLEEGSAGARGLTALVERKTQERYPPAPRAVQTVIADEIARFEQAMGSSSPRGDAVQKTPGDTGLSK
jgi:hypothetical protein